jgi:hypothetical protein
MGLHPLLRFHPDGALVCLIQFPLDPAVHLELANAVTMMQTNSRTVTVGC